ncbi:MAG: hypothetical protein HWD86_01990 [Kangiellaceae bacterium]|nr:hypothetical protein [Kangiellaceae bacterium]
MLVFINTVTSFFFAQDEFKNAFDVLGTLSAIFLFIVAYYQLEQWLRRINKPHLIKRLIATAIIKACTQFYLFLEILTGTLALDFINYFLPRITFVTTFLTTLVDGILLNIIVGLIFLLVNLIVITFQKLRAELSK